MVVGAPAAPYLVLSITRSTEPGDLTLAPEFSSDLQTWTPGGVLVESVPNPDGTVTERWRSDAPLASQARTFARLRITAP